MRQASILALALVLALAACAGEDRPEATTAAPPTTTDQVATTPGAEPTAPTAPPTTPAPDATTSTTSAPDTSSATPATTIEMSIAAGAVTGGGRQQVTLGDQVRLVVTSDVADEVHVHGYDLTAEVGPDRPATLEFPADIPGIFEVELETSHLPLLELVVNP